jgi:Uncharacterized protein conserved in bacteria (DUF2314)
MVKSEMPFGLIRPGCYNRRMTLRITLLTLTVSASALGSGLDRTEFEQLANQGAKNFPTKEGQHYEAQFEKVFLPRFATALRECNNEPDTKEPAMLVFVIAADGRVKQLLHSPNILFGDCVAAKLRTLTTLPRPPRDNWIVSFGAANHHHEEIALKETTRNAPPDKPIQLANKSQLAAYDKALAPYIAKARATFPSAKKRFQAGLPFGHLFLVRTRLTDSRGVVEDCLVEVETIKDGKITGTINRVDVLDNYKRGQRITFSESKIDNWLILRPDGTEEGNKSGNFSTTTNRNSNVMR